MSLDQPPLPLSSGALPEGERLQQHVKGRRTWGTIWQGIFLGATAISILFLITLLFTIINESFGIVAIQYEVNPTSLASRPLNELSKDELIAILKEHSSGNLRRLKREQPFEERTQEDLLIIVQEQVVGVEIVESWPLNESLLSHERIKATAKQQYPDAHLEWRSWMNWSFLVNPMASTPALAGVRTAFLGSLIMIVITMLVAFPLGVGAAIYLEEYANDTRIDLLRRFNAIIQTNINNLAGVPSIIYGMLGLAIFVRALEPITSGALFGATSDPTTANGRTILSASLTMALLVLPILIINAQEAIRAVPSSLRQASYGLGATKWQTIWHHVLPNAMPGILTGTILGMSRAIGETAPLIVVGASTFIVTDPTGPFSKFTALPIQIFNWTARPEAQFRDIAAAAILVLMLLLLTMNTTAIVLRNRFRRSSSL